ncbi:hypothetical protein FB446DRAFT_790964 [Lentinula raphanica]|nr:hypothetical protein FB446DRAFT_790964 [Lentinula raphanica]
MTRRKLALPLEVVFVLIAITTAPEVLAAPTALIALASVDTNELGLPGSQVVTLRASDKSHPPPPSSPPPPSPPPSSPPPSPPPPSSPPPSSPPPSSPPPSSPPPSPSSPPPSSPPLSSPPPSPRSVAGAGTNGTCVDLLREHLTGTGGTSAPRALMGSRLSVSTAGVLVLRVVHLKGIALRVPDFKCIVSIGSLVLAIREHPTGGPVAEHSREWNGWQGRDERRGRGRRERKRGG